MLEFFAIGLPAVMSLLAVYLGIRNELVFRFRTKLLDRQRDICAKIHTASGDERLALYAEIQAIWSGLVKLPPYHIMLLQLHRFSWLKEFNEGYEGYYERQPNHQPAE